MTDNESKELIGKHSSIYAESDGSNSEKPKKIRLTKKKRAEEVEKALAVLYPDAECALESGGDPWKLLVMARLSAQCTDERVNIVCRDLFKIYPDAQSMAKASVEEIGEIIKPCGLWRGKAQSLHDSSVLLIEKFGGVLPDDMDTLLTFPGVGRKIANLLLGDIFKKGGIVADTHCIRICGRLGLYEEGMSEPVKAEKLLDPLIPKDKQSDFCHRIVHFGREWCRARGPRCSECPLQNICKKYSASKG